MELTKYGGTEILAHIKHDLRQIPEGKSYGNESVDLSLSGKNYSLIDRGKTAAEVNKYRKDFESKIFKYNRKNLVHAVELVIQCPNDCPQEQHELFFQTAFDWYCNNYLPAGKRCVFVAEVHKDEHKWVETTEGLKDISKEHLHICYVPAIYAGEKHPDFEYRLNADALTKRAVLRDMHPSLQAELDSKGIKATVFQKKSGDGKTVPLSVKQLKEITNKTGVVIDHTLTLDELATILSKNVELTHTVDALTSTLSEQKQGITELARTLSEKEKQIGSLKSEIQATKSADVSADKVKAELQQKLQEREIENKKLQEQLRTMQEQLKSKDLELQKEHEKVEALESKKSSVDVTPKEHTWGSDSGWGSRSEWGTNNTSKTHTIEEEKLW